MSSKPRFECVAVSGELIAPKEDGKEPTVGVKMRVVSGPATGEDKFWYGNLNGGAAEYTIQALRNMGWTGNDLSNLEGLGSVRFAAVEDVRTLPPKDNKPAKKITQYQIWPIEGRARLDESAGKAMAARFKVLAAAAAPVTVSESNRAPDVIPPSKANGAGTTVEGPALSGTQF